jgi:hypothetical protein
MVGRKSSIPETVPYWLATTAVEFVGTVAKTEPTHGGPMPSPAVSAQASPMVRADRKCPRRELSLDPSKFASEKMTLKFSDDGRLSSSEGNSVGVGPVIVSSVASLAGTAAAAAGGLLGVREVASGKDGVTDRKSESFPDQELLTQILQAQESASARLASVDPTVAGADQEVKAISDLLGALASERTRLEAAKANWSAPGKTTVQSFSYILDASELPSPVQLDPAAASPLAGPAAEVWQNLHVMATIELTEEDAQNQTAPGHDDTKIFFRRPQPATLKVWSRVDSGESWHAVLVSSAPIDLVDKRSPHESLQISEGSLFSNADIAITFGDNGTPTAVTSDQQRGLAAALTAISGATKDLTGGVTAVSDLSGAWQKAAPSAASRQIAALTEEQQRLTLLAEIKALQNPAQPPAKT